MILFDPEHDEDAAYERHQDLLIDMAEEQRAEMLIDAYLEEQADLRAGRIPADPHWEDAHCHEWEDA